MFISQVVASCRRRWVVIVLLLALSAVLLVAAATVIKPTFKAEASVVLIPPASTEFPDQNRYLGLGGLKQSADVLARSMTSDETTDAIKESAPGGTYTVEPDWATSAPILTIAVAASEPGAAQAKLAALLERLPRNLATLQAQVQIRPANQITEVIVTKDEHAVPVEKTRLRLLGLLGVVLVVGSALTTAALDGLLLRRKRRRGDDAGSDEGTKDLPPEAKNVSSDEAVSTHHDRSISTIGHRIPADRPTVSVGRVKR